MAGLPLTRRSYLKSAGAVGAASLLAGCDNDVETPTPTPDPYPDETDAQFVTAELTPTHTNSYNPYDQLSWPTQSSAYLFGDLWDISEKGGGDPRVIGDQGTFMGVLAENWNRDGDILVVTLRDDMIWHNGDPVTAQNLIDTWTLDKLADDRTWTSGVWVDCWVEDEYTAVARLGDAANDYLVADFAANTDVAHHPEVYGRFLPDDGTRGREAYEHMSSSERTQLRKALSSYTVRGKYDPENPEGTVLGWGLWKMKRHGEHEMIFELHEDHPLADRVNYPEVRFEEYTTHQARYQALLADVFSGIDLVVTKPVWEHLPDRYDRYIYNRRLGHGMAFNYDRFPDRRVRQALCYAIDREQVVDDSGIAARLTTPHSFDSALFDAPTPGADRDSAKPRHDLVFGKGWAEDTLTRYDHDREKAASLLEEAGYTREHDGIGFDEWNTPEDELFSVTITVPETWTGVFRMARNEAQQLTDFGIDTDIETQELGGYYGQTMLRGDYDIAHWWTGGARPSPWFAYATIFDSLQTVHDTHNHPTEYEAVPMPVGDPTGTEAVNWAEALDELATTRWRSDRHRELSRHLCWVYNQMMPVYCLNEVNGMATLDTREWGVPDRTEGADRVFFPLAHMGGKKGFVSSRRHL